jgi:hypothetical protein
MDDDGVRPPGARNKRLSYQSGDAMIPIADAQPWTLTFSYSYRLVVLFAGSPTRKSKERCDDSI